MTEESRKDFPEGFTELVHDLTRAERDPQAFLGNFCIVCYPLSELACRVLDMFADMDLIAPRNS